MLWITDTSIPLYKLFDDDLLLNGCAIVNFQQLHDHYGYIAYTPDEEQEVMKVFSGMWDYSWIDVMTVFIS